MNLRKILLRVMIWSLAAAAVLGAVAILTNGSEIVWRIAGTTAVTAACAAAMMAASLLLDKEHGRESGLVGMAAALVAAMFSLLMIWDLDKLLPTRRPEETCGLTIVFLILCALPAMAFLRGRHSSPVRVASGAGIFLTAITFCLLMIPSWYLHEIVQIGTFDLWLGTSTATATFALIAVACLVAPNISNQASRRLMMGMRFIGLIAVALAWGIALYAIWEHIHESSGLFTAIVSVGCLVGLTNLTLLVPLTPNQRWVRIGTLATALIAAICVDALAFTDQIVTNEPLTRIGGAAGFVASCGSLALIIFARINRPISSANRIYREATQIAILCPGCNSKQTLPVGGSTCPVCHLQFTIRIDEPRCVKCDYLLFMLTSDRCPECGTPINQTPSDAGSPLPVVG